MALKELETHLKLDLNSESITEFDTTFLVSQIEIYEENEESEFDDYEEDYNEEFDKFEDNSHQHNSFNSRNSLRKYKNNKDDLEKYKWDF